MVLDNEQLKSLVKFKTGTAIMSCLKFIILYVEDIAEKSKDVTSQQIKS